MKTKFSIDLNLIWNIQFRNFILSFILLLCSFNFSNAFFGYSFLYNSGKYNSETCTSLVSSNGAALDFDGINDNVHVPHSASLDLGNSDPITIEFWFKTYDAGFKPFINKFDPALSYRGYGVALYPGGKIACAKISDAGASNYAQIETVGGGFNDDTWHHTALVMPDADASNYKIYVDGVLQSTAIDANTLTGTSNNSVNLKIGTDESTYYIGRLDEVRIWNKALSSCEIQESMNCELNGSETNLSAYYQFN